MLQKFRDLFLQSEQPKANSEKSSRLAAISLLVEVIKADHTISSEEESYLIKLINESFNLEYHEEAVALINSAKARSQDATSLYEFTQLINEHYSPEKKMQLITMMWQIAFSDGHLDRYEEHLIRRVADLIYLPHMKFIEAKHIAQSSL